MPDFIKNIKKSFERSSLSKENWLDPSDRVLANIEAGINGKESERRYGVLIRLVCLFLVALLVYMFYLKNNRQDSKMATPSTETLQKKDVTNKIELNNILASVTEQENEPVNNKATNLNTPSTTQTNDVANSQSTHSVKISIKNRSSPKLDDGSENFFIQINDRISEPIYRSKDHVKNGSTADLKRESENLNTENIVINAALLNQDGLTQNFTFLTVYDLQELESPSFENKKLPYAGLFLEPVVVNEKARFSLVGNIGYSNWQFILNEEYADAVEPAAFQSTAGNGLSVNVGLEKELGSRLSLGTSFGVQQVNFSSGHNSSVIYDTKSETTDDSSNTKSLTMATPLGFIDSEVQLRRIGDTGSEETSLVLDLHNEHKLTALEFSIYGKYDLIKKDGLDVGFQSGFGILMLSAVDNKLTSFDSDNDFFSSGVNTVTSSFVELNRVTPVVSFGLNVMKALRYDISVGVSLGGRFNLHAIQTTGEFETSLRRYEAGLFIRKSF